METTVQIAKHILFQKTKNPLLGDFLLLYLLNFTLIPNLLDHPLTAKPPLTGVDAT